MTQTPWCMKIKQEHVLLSPSYFYFCCSPSVFITAVLSSSWVVEVAPVLMTETAIGWETLRGITIGITDTGIGLLHQNIMKVSVCSFRYQQKQKNWQAHEEQWNFPKFGWLINLLEQIKTFTFSKFKSMTNRLCGSWWHLPDRPTLFDLNQINQILILTVYHFQVSHQSRQLQHPPQEPLRPCLLACLPEYWRMAMTMTARDNIMDRMSMLGV